MERCGLGERVTVEDHHGPRRVRRYLEGVEIGEVESSVSFRRTEVQASKVIRHGIPLIAVLDERLSQGYSP